MALKYVMVRVVRHPHRESDNASETVSKIYAKIREDFEHYMKKKIYSILIPLSYGYNLRLSSLYRGIKAERLNSKSEA